MQQDIEPVAAPVQASLPQKPAMQPQAQQHYAALQQQQLPTPLPQVCARLSSYSVRV